MEIFVISIEHDKNKIFIYGRDKDWNKVIIESEQPYYVYILPKREFFEEVFNLIKTQSYVKSINVERRKFKNKEYDALKIILDEDKYELIKNFADKLKSEGKIDGKKEGDIPITKKFQIDNSIYPMNWYDLELEELYKIRDITVYKLKKNNGIIERKYNLKVISLDIEVYFDKIFPNPEKDQIISISLYDGNKFYSINQFYEYKDSIYSKNEYDLLENLNNLIKKLDPDVIVGYNSNNFDFYFLYERSKKLNFKFNFGWDGSGFILTKKKEEDKKYKSIGVQLLDLYEIIVNLFSGQLKTEKYDLNSVSEEILGYGKKEIDINNIKDYINKDKIGYLIEYNRRDAELIFNLYKHFEGILLELCKLTGISLYELTSATYGILVENYLIKRSREFNLIIPNKPKKEELEYRKKITYLGAFVLEPKPGIYKNISVYDFRSLYPSIIIRHNISPEVLKCEHEECKEEKIEVETSLGKDVVWYCKKNEGFIPKILKEIFEERSKIKKELKSLDKKSEEYKILDSKQYALKILANSMYGYLGFINSRWYCLECVASVTAYGRKYIQEVIKSIEEKGYKVIYGDTDSVFVLIDKEGSKKLLEELNNKLPKPLELELENYYVSGIFVRKKGEYSGAKKKYALLSEDGSIKLRGFEVVRRDWSKLAKEVQSNVIKLALTGDRSSIINYLRDVIEKIKRGEFSLEYFIIYEQLKKDLSEYKVDAPHVVAAKKYKNLGINVGKGFIVEYVVCKGGGKISEKVRLPSECKREDIDIDYYINKQIFASVESILDTLKISKEDVLNPKKDIFSFLNRKDK